MSTREDILSAVRDGLGSSAVDAALVRRDALDLLQDLPAIRPALPPGSLTDAFATRLVSPKVAATVDRIDRMEEFPAAVKRYLQLHGLAPALYLQPAAVLMGLDWQGFQRSEALTSDQLVGIGIARWGIAETGSLVLHSGVDTPVLASFLPLHHVVVVQAVDIVAYLEDYAAAFAATGEPHPRNANLITGASGTTDIEGTLVRGAHGPQFLHVVIIDAAEARNI